MLISRDIIGWRFPLFFSPCSNYICYLYTLLNHDILTILPQATLAGGYLSVAETKHTYIYITIVFHLRDAAVGHKVGLYLQNTSYTALSQRLFLAMLLWQNKTTTVKGVLTDNVNPICAQFGSGQPYTTEINVKECLQVLSITKTTLKTEQIYLLIKQDVHLCTLNALSVSLIKFGTNKANEPSIQLKFIIPRHNSRYLVDALLGQFLD